MNSVCSFFPFYSHESQLKQGQIKKLLELIKTVFKQFSAFSAKVLSDILKGKKALILCFSQHNCHVLDTPL